MVKRLSNVQVSFSIGELRPHKANDDDDGREQQINRIYRGLMQQAGRIEIFKGRDIL